MPLITVDSEPIEIQTPPHKVFLDFSKLAYSRLSNLFELPKEKRHIGQLPVGYLLSRQVQDESLDDPFSYAALQNLHDLGVREIDLHPEDGTANVRKSEHTDCSLGRSSWIDHSTVNSGRAYIAALNGILHRTFKLNGTEIDVGIQPTDAMKQAQATLGKAKGDNESLLFAAVRIMSSLLKQRLGIETTEMRCMIELASGLGLSAADIDVEKNTILFRSFSEMAAISTALLHGAKWDMIKEIRRQVQQLASQTSQAGSVGTGIASYNPASVKRRRRV